MKVYFQLPVSLADEHKLIFVVNMQASESFTEFYRRQIAAIKVFSCFHNCATKQNSFTILSNANQNGKYSVSRRKSVGDKYLSPCLSESMCEEVLQRHFIF